MARDGYWQFDTLTEASAFFAGVDFAKHEELSVYSPYFEPENGVWEVKVRDFIREPCPYCEAEECDFNGTHACDGSAGDIDGLESEE
jgi:hypothetical protein